MQIENLYLNVSLEQLKNASLPLPEEISHGLTLLKKEITSYFKQFDISTFLWPDKIYFVPKSLYENYFGSRYDYNRIGAVHMGNVFISKCKKRWTNDVYLYFLFKTIVHEIYHITGYSNQNKKYRLSLAYQRQKKVGFGAIEEGMADIASLEYEHLIFKYIKPDTINELKKAKNAFDSHAILPNQHPDLFSTVNTIFESKYHFSILLVQYLQIGNRAIINGNRKFDWNFKNNFRGIEDINRLIEMARIEYKILPLARAIDSHFGKGAYRIIASASNDREVIGVLYSLWERRRKIISAN